MPELSERDADFVNIGARLRPEWLANWVRTPQGDCPPVASADADDVLAWFLKDVKPVLREAVQPSGDGQKLIEALHLAPWLEEIRGKYTHVGLREFLANPTAHHPDTLFPTLALSPGEVEAIALSLDQPAVGLAVKGDAERGENIVAQRCDMCHGKAKPTATGLAKTWKRGWAQLATHDPPLGLSEDQVSALRAFQNADSDSGLRSLRYVTPREYAERTIDRLRCAQCHASATGLPDITTAGSKLQGSWLAEFLRGAHAPTRPWLAARMPAFSSRADTLARGICDREGILFADSASANSASANSATGAELSGLQGYACNACHAVGDQPAIQAFEGQGPNLGLAKARLRWDYFQRWMHHPQRIQPSTIMPRYSLNKTRAAKADVLAGDAAAQFAAIWAWLQGI
jgi:cytochrome c5